LSFLWEQSQHTKTYAWEHHGCITCNVYSIVINPTGNVNDGNGV
jgi:hypothetical protein